jgi:hypothetical protein
MIFVSLHKGRVHLKPDSEKDSKGFRRDDWEGMGRLLVKQGQWDFMCSSSVNHPQEYGFPRSFNVDKVLGKAVDYAYGKLAIPVKGLDTIKKTAAYIEKLAQGKRFPLSFCFVKSGKKKADVVVVFREENELIHFLCGMRYGSNIAPR